jgi:hypothetical protein
MLALLVTVIDNETLLFAGSGVTCASVNNGQNNSKRLVRTTPSFFMCFPFHLNLNGYFLPTEKTSDFPRVHITSP